MTLQRPAQPPRMTSMVFNVIPHDPMPCGRCGTEIRATEWTCSTCYPKGDAK